MKNHAVRAWPAFAGMSDTDPDDRIPEEELSFLLNAVCDPTGRIVPWDAVYPVTAADVFGITVKSKLFSAARFKGKNGVARAVAIVGSGMYRSGPNNIYDSPWPMVTFGADYSTPALNRAAAFVFYNRYCYHQNGVDLPFRVKMEEDDGSSASTTAEILGLRAPLSPSDNGAESGTSIKRFPDDRATGYALTFVYGDRGESGPSPVRTLEPNVASDTLTLTEVPLGPAGVTARRIYRTKIGAAKGIASSDPKRIDLPTSLELFFLAEITDNTSTSFADTLDDSAMDYSRRLPPPRPMVPLAKYQVAHQDRIVWGNIAESPLVMHVCSGQSPGVATSASVTVSNTGNGTITLKFDGATSITVSDYKTKSLATIRAAIMSATWSSSMGTTGGGSGSGFLCRVAPGVDDTRTYRFREVTDQPIFTNAQVYSFEAYDDTSDAVVVDGLQRYPNEIMFSNGPYIEEINPLNRFPLSRNDVYPLTGLFRNDYTLGAMTEDAIWLMTGSLSADPVTFEPDFSISRSQSEHGSYCTRPDAIIEAPGGIYFVAKDGLRRFQGQNSVLVYRQIKRRLMERILVEPRARDNLCMSYWNGKLHIAFAGMEVA